MKNQRGIALLVAVLIVSLVVTISTVINTYLSIDLELVRFMIISDELEGYSGKIEADLKNDWIKDGIGIIKKIDQGKYFVDGVFTYEEKNIDNKEISGEVIDQSGLFNLNYLYDPSICDDGSQPPTARDQKLYIMRSTYKNLIEAALIKTEENLDSEKLVENTQKWLCPGNNAAIDQVYLNKNPPYVHAGQPFVSITELKLVDGITEKLWEEMKNNITAWPVSSNSEISFNPATIRPQILAAMSGRNVDDAIFANRSYITVNQENNHINYDVEINLILESSNYIELQKTEEDRNNFQKMVKNTIFKDTKHLFKMGYKVLVVSKTKKTSNLLALYTMLSIKAKDSIVLWRSRGSY